MLTGVVIAESLHTDAQLDGKVINIARVTRVAVEGAGNGQPPVWTLLEFEVEPRDRRDGDGVPRGSWT